MTDSSTTPGPHRRGPSDADLERAVPRDSGSRQARVGLFVIMGITSFIVVLFLLTDPATLRGRYMLITRMTDAGGVRSGDPVQMRGVNVGRVHGFEMEPEGDVFISLEIEGEWRIPVGSSVELEGMGLFGGRTVSIIPAEGSTFHEEGDTLPGTSGDGDLMASAGDVAGQAGTVLERVSEVLDEPTVGSLRSAVTELEGLLTELHRMTAAQRDEIDRLSGSLARTAEGLEAAAAAGPDAARAVARADSAMANLRETSGTLGEVATTLRDILARMEAGEGTLGRLSRDDALYQNFSRAAESAHLLLEDLRANPSKYINVSIF